MTSIFQTWMPSQLADAPAQDRQQLAALSSALAASWSSDASLVDRLAETVKWIPLVKTLLETNAQFEAEDIRRLADTLLDIVLHGTGDQVALVRWAGVLSKVLGSYRHKLRGFIIPWRPLHQLIRQQCIAAPTEYVGPMVFEAQRSVLVKFVRKCRRYFATGTAVEVWAEFAKPLGSPLQPAAFEALGFLNLLMPTHAIAARQGEWSRWVPMWLDLQDGVAHCRWWDATWMDLISRVAKHDKHGVVAWSALVPRLYTSLMWAFHVPVGTATATPPFNRSPPTLISSVLAGESTSRSVHGAKLAVWLLGHAERAKEGNGHVQEMQTDSSHENGQPVGKGFAAVEAELQAAAEHGYCGDSALAALAKTGDLIEQYLHPSNNGQWVSNLSRFLQHVVGQLGRRLTLENSPKDLEDGSDSESDDGSEAPMSGQGDEQAELEDGDEDIGDVEIVGGARTPLSSAVQRTVAAIVIRLASRAQYSKDNILNSIACHALARMAYIAPDLVLPIMHERFELALESVSAVHQLTSAFHTMSLCTRPLLIAGFRATAGDDEPIVLDPSTTSLTPEQVAAGQLLARALTASLPGIDANDPPKSLSCFRLYTVALCSIGALKDEADAAAADAAGFQLPLYADEWVEELLSRIFATLSNLENPNHGDDSARVSFLLEGNSMFRPMVELLFARLPPTTRVRAISRLARFVTTNTLPSVTQEAAILCNAAGWADPAAAAAQLLAPLLEQLEGELPGLERLNLSSDSSAEVSKVQEASVTWRLGLLSSAAFHMGSHLVPYKKRLRTVLSVCFNTTSQTLQTAAMRALSSILYGLVHYFPEDEFAAPDLPGVEPFIDKKGRPLGTPPRWHDPSAEEVAFAEELVQEFLLGAAAELQTLCLSAAPAEADSNGGGNGAKHARKRIRSLLLRMEGVVIGARTCLPDFEHSAPPGDAGTSLAIMGSVGAQVGTPAAREALAEALMAAATHVSDSDSETLLILLRLVEATLAAGLHEYTDHSQSLSAWRSDEKLVHEPALAFMLQASGSGKWRRRRARWLMAERTYITGIWRASQAAYRPWATTAHPRATEDMIPPTTKRLTALLLRYALNPYTDLRNRGGQAIDGVMRRYPELVPSVLPAVLRALAGLPDDSGGSESLLQPAGVNAELLQELRAAVQAAVASEPTANGKERSTGDLVKEGRGIGAAAVLQARVVWRRVCRDPDAFTATMTALLASAALSTKRAQTAVTHLFVTVAFRFVRPPAIRAAKAAGEAVPAHMTQLQRDVLQLASGDARSTRYAMLANALLLLLAPLPTDIAEQAAQHWMGLLQGGLLSHQALAITAFTAFMGDSSGDPAPMAATLTATVGRVLREHRAVGQAIMAQLAHNHPHHDAGEEGGGREQMRAMFGQMSRGDAAVGAMRVAFDRFREWPARSTRALQDGTFKVPHARLVQVLAAAEPAAALAAFREPLQAALAGPQDADRPRTYAAAEVLAGLLASGALFAADAEAETAWDAWLAALLRNALSAAPMDMAGLWGVAVRFGLNGIIGGRRDAVALSSVLELISEPTGPGAPSSAIIKRGRCMYHAAAELADLGIGGDGGGALDAAARAFQRRALTEAPALMKHTAEAVQLETMRTAAVVCGLVYQQAAARGGNAPANPESSLDGDAASFCDHAVACLDAGVTAVYDAVDGAATRAAGEETDSAAGKAKAAVPDEVAAELGAALLFLSEGVRWGEGPQLAPTAVRMLPSLLRLQEVKVPELQRLELLGKTALAVVKYLPLPASLAARATGVLVSAPAAEPWSARAAALVFAQYFWFRHAHLLSREDDDRLQAVVVRMLSDSKLEVREVAATTLSGLLKGAKADEADRLRASFLADVDRLLLRNRKRQKAKAGADASGPALAERHAAVLGLQAFVQLSAYDVPAWLPGVLTALASAAVEPAPIRTTVRRALGDFRRTHEESGLAEMRRLLTPEEYEAIQEVEAPASYYI